MENFWTVAQAAVKLGFRDKDDPTTAGEKVLRDGVNKLGWPSTRRGRRLMFSDSHLAEIDGILRTRKDLRTGRRRNTTSAYRPRRPRAKTTALTGS